ncbi:MAG TPA: diiron oxygenase [Polyangiaceae bacterium]
MEHLLLASGPRPAARRESYRERVLRLSARSVTKHFDAYADIAWDRPEYHLALDDPRWQKRDDDPLGRTAWYKSQPEAQRARIGLHHVVEQMKIGVDFEAVLARGLLEFVSTLSSGSPELRYAFHELIEEGQHSLMFHEFIARSGLPVRGVTGLEGWVSRRVPRLGRAFPELFFVFVLGGEAPIDYVQRRMLAGGGLHPLLQRVMQLHVIEEARHVCFASEYLRHRAAHLGAFRRARMRIAAPVILPMMAKLMLKPSSVLIREYRIPSSVVREAYTGAYFQRMIEDGIRPVRELCREIGLVHRFS